ncbi:MAG: transposase [Merdibacter sp.]
MPAGPASLKAGIVSYDKQTNIVHWFYHDHEDEKRYDVIESAIEFIKKLIIHIPDPHFRNIRYYGFYSNASRKELDHIHELLGIRKHKDYSKKTRQQKQQRKMNKLRYRTHLIDSFNRDPLKCRCGHYMKYEYTYDPLEGRHNDRTYRKECIDEMQGLQIRRAGP